MKDIYAKHAHQDDKPTNDYEHGGILLAKPWASRVEERGFLMPVSPYRRIMVSLKYFESNRVETSVYIA
jgi:hypothetical protein